LLRLACRHPHRHYRGERDADRLKRLGGFAASKKNVMMMKQWGHVQAEGGARATSAARTAMWITVWSVVVAFAMFCAVSAALAETYTPHARRITPRYTTAHFVTHGARTRVRATNVHGGRTVAHKVSVEGSRRLARVEAAPSHRMSVAERRSARDASASMRRVSERHRGGERATSTDRLDVVAGVKAHAPGAGVYANGVAHPDEKVSVAGAGESHEGALPEVTASVDALPAQRVPAPLQSSGPSDLVGAPVNTTAGPETRASTVGGMSLATREAIAEEAGTPEVLPGLYRYGRLVVPPPMRGTREILVHQNLIADEEGLSRIQDDEDLRRMRGERMLVDFPESASLHVNAELAGDRRCARPWTVRFAADIARAYYVRFHQPLQVNSAVRTVAYQVRLRRTNGNAAGIGGEMASPHLTGEAIDFGKRDMTTEEIAWMRTYLRPLMQVGKVDVEEEFQQACFHISVYRSYAPGMAVSRREYAEVGSPRVTRARADVDQ